MKLQMILRMLAVVIVFAGVLLLARSVSAQEITNTSFDDGQNVAPFAQPATAATASDSNSTIEEPQAVMPAAMISEPTVVQEAGISMWSSLGGWLMAIFLVGIAVVALYALSEAKRANRNLAARLGQIKRRSAVS